MLSTLQWNPQQCVDAWTRCDVTLSYFAACLCERLYFYYCISLRNDTSFRVWPLGGISTSLWPLHSIRCSSACTSSFRRFISTYLHSAEFCILLPFAPLVFLRNVWIPSAFMSVHIILFDKCVSVSFTTFQFIKQELPHLGRAYKHFCAFWKTYLMRFHIGIVGCKHIKYPLGVKEHLSRGTDA